MEHLKNLYANLSENVRLLKNFIKTLKNQQLALVNNDIIKIQESALMQASLMEKIALNQQLTERIVEKLNAFYSVNLKEDKLPSLKDKISSTWYKKINRLLDLQEIYMMEINENKKNNRILLENAIDFVQGQMKIIVDIARETPFYDKNQTGQRTTAAYLLNKKM